MLDVKSFLRKFQQRKWVCKVRNKAIQGYEKDCAKYHIGDTYYERNARDDICLFMRCIRRNIGRTIPTEYLPLELYYKQQRNHFQKIRRIRKRTYANIELPGKTSYNQAGHYNGLPWVLLCLNAAFKFDEKTKPSTLYSFFWWFLSIVRG